MAIQPISKAPIQYMASSTALATGYFLKGYAKDTNDPLSMYTDTTGATSLAKCKLNTLAYPLSNPSDDTTVFIPHFNQDFKLALYTNETDADADTFANAVWVVDDISLGARFSPLEITSDTTLTITHDCNFIVVTGSNNVDITVPPEASEDLGYGFTCVIRHDGTGTLTIVAGSDVTVVAPAGGTLVVPSNGTVQLFYAAITTDRWFLYGQVNET